MTDNNSLTSIQFRGGSAVPILPDAALSFVGWAKYMKQKSFVIIGAGPAGLSAAYELTRHGVAPVVIEKDQIVGGIARTETYKGYHFDMGGHRFFTKSSEVDDFWNEVLGDDFLRRPRMSRIYYRKRFFHYPLKPLNVLKNFGLVESARVI